MYVELSRARQAAQEEKSKERTKVDQRQDFLPIPCNSLPCRIHYGSVLEGWRIASSASSGRKVRTPQGAIPRNPSQDGIRAGNPEQSGLTDSATENKPPPRFGAEVRVKRRSKSPPLQEKSRRHGKPYREQGQIGDNGAACSKAERPGLGYWLLRQMILSASQEAQTKFGLQPFQN